MLDSLPKNVYLSNHDFILRGVIEFNTPEKSSLRISSGHYIGYAHRSNGDWEVYDDTKEKIIKIWIVNHQTLKQTVLISAILIISQQVRVVLLPTKDPRTELMSTTTAISLTPTMTVMFKKNEQVHTMDL
ncbi:hypothetical protein ACI65C_002089 [Semiaphis heraclei]